MEAKNNHFFFTRDVEFSSPSAAASVVNEAAEKVEHSLRECGFCTLFILIQNRRCPNLAAVEALDDAPTALAERVLYFFSSLVNGGNMNGLLAWRDEHGVTLGELEKD